MARVKGSEREPGPEQDQGSMSDSSVRRYREHSLRVVFDCLPVSLGVQLIPREGGFKGMIAVIVRLVEILARVSIPLYY